jgi:hypothetical protein
MRQVWQNTLSASVLHHYSIEGHPEQHVVSMNVKPQTYTGYVYNCIQTVLHNIFSIFGHKTKDAIIGKSLHVEITVEIQHMHGQVWFS